MNGKGDTRRPCLVDQETLARNWNLAFGGRESAIETQDSDSEDTMLGIARTGEHDG